MCVSVCVSGAARGGGGAPAFRQEAEGPCELANRSLGVQPDDRQLEPKAATAPLQDMAASRGVLRGGAVSEQRPRQHALCGGLTLREPIAASMLWLACFRPAPGGAAPPLSHPATASGANAALLAACNAGDVDALSAALNSGADVNCRQRGSLDSGLHTIACWATSDAPRFYTAAHLLLHYGADVDARNCHGASGGKAATWAARPWVRCGRSGLLSWLTRHLFLRAGQTPLHLAAARDLCHLVDLLLTARANPNARTSVEGETSAVLPCDTGRSTDSFDITQAGARSITQPSTPQMQWFERCSPPARRWMRVQTAVQRRCSLPAFEQMVPPSWACSPSGRQTLKPQRS